MLAEKPSYRWRRCNGIQYVRFLGQIYVNKSRIYFVCMRSMQTWQTWFSCGDSDYFWDSVGSKLNFWITSIIKKKKKSITMYDFFFKNTRYSYLWTFSVCWAHVFSPWKLVVYSKIQIWTRMIVSSTKKFHKLLNSPASSFTEKWKSKDTALRSLH